MPVTPPLRASVAQQGQGEADGVGEGEKKEEEQEEEQEEEEDGGGGEEEEQTACRMLQACGRAASG